MFILTTITSGSGNLDLKQKCMFVCGRYKNEKKMTGTEKNWQYVNKVSIKYQWSGLINFKQIFQINCKEKIK